MIDLCRRVYPESPPWKVEQLESHLAVFPEGQFVVVERKSGRIVGMAASLVVRWDDYAFDAEWREWTAGGYFTNHDPANGRTLYVPVGFAHGFQTLEGETHVLYSVSHPYTPGAEGGVRHDDPVFGITWPLPISVVSEKDQGWPPVDLAKGIRI